MGVGTSLGQSYDDEFHWSQSQWDDKYDTNKAEAISIKPVQEAAPEPTPEPASTPEATPDIHPEPYGLNPPPSKFFDKLFGLNGEERYHTWPERAFVDAYHIAGKVAAGEVPMWSQDADTGEYHTSIEGMQHAWELMPLAMGGQIPLKVHLGQPSEVTTLKTLSQHQDEFDAMIRRYHEEGSASQRIARENPEPAGHSLTPEEAANRYHNLPHGENIRFAHEYEELATDAQYSEYERLVNNRHSDANHPEPALNSNEWRQFEADMAAYDARHAARFEADMRAQDLHASDPTRLARDAEWIERSQSNHSTEATRYANEIRELLRQSRLQESYKTKALGSDTISEGQIYLARLKSPYQTHETQHKFRFFDEKTGSQGHLDITEKKDGKLLYVEGIGLNDLIRPQDIGSRGMKDMLYALKREFPEALAIGGFRISGARRIPAYAEMKLPKGTR